ncbi:MAG TPA: alkaline phosphatase family protein [Gemmatimonadaceae bacterium]
MTGAVTEDSNQGERSRPRLLLLGALALLLAACGGTEEGTTAIQPARDGRLPRFSHVIVVVEENRNYGSAIGGTEMPYLDSLAGAYGLATQYHANTHPSIGNYFMLTTGRVVTNDDGFSGTVSGDNIVRQLVAAGLTWKAYAEDLPSVGYVGGGSGTYARRHNPLSYLTDVVNDSAQRRNIVPFTQFATDLQRDSLPSYAFIVPNLCNDAHDCRLSMADAWLHANIAPLIASPTFQRDGLLIITFDEAGSDDAGGGGRVAWVVVSPKAKRGYRSAAWYQHESTLRLTAEALGLTHFPGASATASNMAEFFEGQ